MYFDELATEPMEPMDAARAFRDLKRERKTIKARDTELVRQEALLAAVVYDHMENGRLPHSISLKKDGGGNVHTRNEIYPRLKVGVHPDVAKDIFQRHNLSYMFSDKPNSQSLRGYINQYLSDDETLPARERVDTEQVPSEVLDILVIEDNYKVAANGL